MSTDTQTKKRFTFDASQVDTQIPELTDERPGNMPEAIERKMRDVLPMKPEMIPRRLRPWLTDISDRMRCPLDFVAVAAIVSAGAIVGSRCGVYPKQQDGWNEVPNLWGCIIADPSKLKSPSISEVFKTYKPLEEKANAEYKAASLDAKVNEQMLEKQKKTALNSLNKDADKEDVRRQLLAIESELEGVEAKKRIYRINDATHQRIIELSAANPQGFLVYRDELTGLLKGWEKQGNEDARGFYLEGWNGKNPYEKSLVGKGDISVPNLCLSLFGGIQPDKLQALLSSVSAGDNDGLLQRFQLMVYPDSRGFEYIDRRPDGRAFAEASEVYEALADMTPAGFVSFGAEIDEFSNRPMFRFDSEAQSVFVEWFTDLNDNRLTDQDISPYEAQHFAKYRGLMPKLALLFHLIDAVSDGITGCISIEATRQAIQWIKYLESHARRVYAISSDSKQAAFALSKKISSGKLENGFTRRDIERNEWHLLKDRGIIDQAITELLEAEWIQEIQTEPNKIGRKPLKSYSINPNSAGYYKAQKS